MAAVAEHCGLGGRVMGLSRLQSIVHDGESRRFRRGRHYGEAQVLAQTIEVGGDTDTIASITGQIAGTAAGVPPDYAEHFFRITGGDEIIRVAESFADFLSTRPTPE
jgi:hypothetical protein